MEKGLVSGRLAVTDSTHVKTNTSRASEQAIEVLEEAGNYWKLLDTYEEERLGGKSFGSTKSGIAPFYSDKYAKIGIQVCDLFHEDRLRERLTAAVSLKNVLFEHLYHKPSLDVDELYQQLMELREQIRPYVGDAVTFVHDALRAGKTVLLEGQLGSMKDPDLGIFPLTTSSHTLAGFGCVGAAVPPTAVEDVICVTKAYSSSVGSNTEPFVSEVLGEAGDELRRRGGDKGEFGATTGRPRRVGWFDTVATKYGCMVQGATQVALTCLDVLGYLDEIPVCTGYEIDGTVTDRFPTTPELMRKDHLFAIRSAHLPPVTIHGLRHTMATLSAGAGCPMKLLQSALGHSTYQLTADLYAAHLLPPSAAPGLVWQGLAVI